MRRIDRDVDPVLVAESIARRDAYLARMKADYGLPMRCKTNVCDQDGSCVACGDDQGESSRCAALTGGER